jgi:hypothetical protein
MTGRDWIATFAQRLGMTPPDEATIEALLEIAGVAAHGSERIAAPIACYLIGRANADLREARSAAESIAADT